MARLVEDFYNHGSDGVKTRVIKLDCTFNAFVERQDAIREERKAAEEKADRRANLKANVAIAIGTIAAALLAFLTWLHVNEAVHTGRLHFPKMMSQDVVQTYTENRRPTKADTDTDIMWGR